MKPILAIVIPAYKSKFLYETLNALSKQQSKSFNLYIGDDNSPENIRSIVNQFDFKLKINYKKFENNLGGTSLTEHWNRCIEMVEHEDWIWLLPDDDVPSYECVSTFLGVNDLDLKQEALFRFQTVHIDEFNTIVYRPPLQPEVETNVDFIMRKLQYECNSSVAEYIFSKKAYYNVEGFKNLPLGWCADDLLWCKISHHSYIKTLPKGIVCLRQSSLNISNNTILYSKDKIDAKYLFLQELIKDNLFINKLLKKYTHKEFKRILAFHIFSELKNYKVNFFKVNFIYYAKRNSNLIGGSFFKNIYRIFRYQIKNHLI